MTEKQSNSPEDGAKASVGTLHCLDLFSGLGGFSAAFEDSERWDVTTVDIRPEFDPDDVEGRGSQ